jgi:hypothetical protein
MITQSREETLAEARTSLSAADPAAIVTVARGNAGGGATRTWIEQTQVPAAASWTDLGRILFQVTRQGPSGLVRETASKDCSTFLYAIRKAALEQGGKARHGFVHAGKVYLLETERRPDRPPILSGVIRDEAGARRSEFQATYESGDPSGLPVRIQYRPRSFLRLTFEAEPHSIHPAIPSVFEESA